MTTTRKTQGTTDALAILGRLSAGDPGMGRLIAEESSRLSVARQALKLRLDAGLEISSLARKTKLPAAALRQLEDACYEGDSLALLERVAGTLGRSVIIRLAPARKTLQAA